MAGFLALDGDLVPRVYRIRATSTATGMVVADTTGTFCPPELADIRSRILAEFAKDGIGPVTLDIWPA